MPSYLSLAEITQDESIIKTSALIGSQWIDGKQKFAVMNPAIGKEIAFITDVGRDEIMVYPVHHIVDKVWVAHCFGTTRVTLVYPLAQQPGGAREMG